jgi:chromosome segregation ATPase
MSKFDNFKDRIDTLKENYPTYLESFINYYQETHVKPDDENAKKLYDASVDNLRKAADGIFTINNEIQTELKTLETELATWNTKISNANKLTTDLQTNYNNHTGDINGAQTLINDYKSIYVLQYISNVSLFLGMILMGYLIINKLRRQSSA